MLWLWNTLFLVVSVLAKSVAEGETPPPQPPQEVASPVQSNCVDSDPKCGLWASQGECQTNSIWMMSNCRRSCQSCQGGDRAWQLRTQLAKNYDNASNSNATRTVRIESVRISHMEIDETRELARLFGRLVLSWNDSKVSWDREHWGVSWLNFYWVQIWTPQLMQINSPSATPGQINGKVLAANYTGQVYMWTDFQFVVPYHFEYEDFPKDRQRICYQFDDKRYFAVRFVVADDVRNKRHESISEAHVSGWNILEMDIRDSKYVVQLLGDWRQNPFDIQSTNCELCIRLQRNAVYWLAELLAPALVTSALTLCAVLFQLALPQALLLSFSLLSQLLSMQLMNTRMPSYTGTAPAILKFAAFNLLSTGALFICTLLLRRFSHTNSNIPLPRSVYALASLLDRLMPWPKGAKELSEENVPQGNYTEIAMTLNNLLFCIFTFIYGWTIIFTLII
uniref:ShKT domain-containing protein n=1 Tax=Globodera pallida TaxID=36090 RepID=A0A183CAP5_GLOPA